MVDAGNMAIKFKASILNCRKYLWCMQQGHVLV